MKGIINSNSFLYLYSIFHFLIMVIQCSLKDNDTIITTEYQNLYQTYAVKLVVPLTEKMSLTGTRRIDLQNQFFIFEKPQMNESDLNFYEPYYNLKCNIERGPLCINNITFNIFYYNNLNTQHYPLSYQNLPLSYKFYNNSFSLIYSMLNDSMISHALFAIEPIDQRKGYFHMGGVPKESIDNKYKATLTVDQNYDTWGTNLDYIKINSHIFRYNRYIKFQANISELYVSIDFLNFLNTSLLKPYFSNKTCRYEDRYYKKYYECQCGVFNSFPSISFMINGTLFEFQMKNMKDRPERKDNENCTLLLVNTESEMNNSQFIFGTFFLQNFISVFDYESSSITFYSKFPFSSLSHNIIVLIQFNFAFLLVNSLYLLYVKHSA